MAVYVPAGQSHQLVGLPPLSDDTYTRLAATFTDILKEYYIPVNTAMDPSDDYVI